jgi:flagellar FliL protein
MKSRLKFVVPIVLVLAVAAWKLVLSKPDASAKAKVAGQVYVLPKDFLINLSDGQFGKVSVGLVLDHAQPLGGDHGATPPEGFGALAQEPVVRDIVTDELTDADADRLKSHAGRDALKHTILNAIRHRTDVKVDDVLLMDVTVQ